MKTIYISGIKMDANCTKPSEIQEYRMSFEPLDSGVFYAKNDFFKNYFSEINDYISYNFQTQESVKCEVNKSINGEYFFQTLGNDSKTDNLLSLQRYL